MIDYKHRYNLIFLPVMLFVNNPLTLGIVRYLQYLKTKEICLSLLKTLKKTARAFLKLMKRAKSRRNDLCEKPNERPHY